MRRPGGADLVTGHHLAAGLATAVRVPGSNGTVQVRCSLPVLPLGLV